jgi:redox-sensitive bicupin YhaK (pirin superfamily)
MAIWLIRVAPGAQWELPATGPGVNRVLHCFEGTDVQVGSASVAAKTGIRLGSDLAAPIVNHGDSAEFLLLQGKPIGAPVFQMGPFVMNSAEELKQAVDDYRRTQFGGWPWPTRSPVHARSDGRFAIHADGRVEQREMQPAR